MRISRTPVLLVVLVAAAWSPGARAQDPPVTMGSLVLRMAMSDATVRPVLLASTAHPEPGMRAVAARVAGTGSHVAMADALIVALAHEREPLVAAEQVRALLLIGTPEGKAAVERHLATADAPAVVA